MQDGLAFYVGGNASEEQVGWLELGGRVVFQWVVFHTQKLS